MHSTPSIALLCCCMQMFCGLDALVFCNAYRGWSLLVLRGFSDFLCKVKKVLPR